MKKLSKEFLKAVGEYMLVETPLAKADLCLLFGGERADELAARAAELYHQGYFPLIVVSGGVKTSCTRLTPPWADVAAAIDTTRSPTCHTCSSPPASREVT